MTSTLHVGTGTHRGPLSLFPVWRATAPGPVVALADERTVAVRELDDPQVPRLRVTATTPLPVLLLDGLLLRGGWQDRTAVTSALLTPGRETDVEVRCVEPHRWGGATAHVAGGRSSTRVRAVTEQDEVWRRVAQEHARLAEPPAVDDLDPLPGQSGVLVGIGGSPLALELFAHPDLLAAAWAELVAAAARDAAGAPLRRTTSHDARGFAVAAAGVGLTATGRAGQGRALRGSRGSLHGRGVEWRGRALHTCVLDHAHQAVSA
ncbi:hypothetical protein GCM10027047_03050 [Rhodococcus aerolatus]